MKDFDFFLKKGDVRRQKPDLNLSKATLREGVERLAFVQVWEDGGSVVKL